MDGETQNTVDDESSLASASAQYCTNPHYLYILGDFIIKGEQM